MAAGGGGQSRHNRRTGAGAARSSAWPHYAARRNAGELVLSLIVGGERVTVRAGRTANDVPLLIVPGMAGGAVPWPVRAEDASLVAKLADLLERSGPQFIAAARRHVALTKVKASAMAAARVKAKAAAPTRKPTAKTTKGRKARAA